MKNIAVLLGLLLCLCASSWAACTSSNYVYNKKSCPDYGGSICYISGGAGFNNCYLGYNCGYRDCSDQCNFGNCDSQIISGSSIYVLTSVDDPRDRYSSCTNITCASLSTGCYYGVVCTTQAEADSVTIAQKCTSGTMVKDTVNAIIFDACKNGEGLLIAFNNPITGVRNSSIGYYIVTDGSADSLDEATYNHLTSLACTEVSLYRGVLNGKYVYWYSTEPEPAGVVNVVRIK